MSKNILELCLSPDLGGLELYMVRASHYLHEKTKVISVINETGKLEQYYKETPYKYEKIKRSSISSFLTARKLARIIDKNKIDVVHLHWTKDIQVAVLAKLLSTCKPKLVQTRNMTMTRFKDDFYHRWLYKNMDMMLAVTHQVKEQIERFVPQDIRPKVEVLYMGAEVPELIGDEEKQTLKKQYGLSNAFTVGIVGRIEEGKGQYLVIDAVKKLLHEGLNVQALIVGHAMHERYLKSLKNAIKKDHLEDKIIFSGFTREAQKLMQIFDCLVLATDRETFGLVLIEAMACGICTIGTNNAGPLEIIDDNETGLLFEKNSSDDLAKKIRLLVEDSEFKNQLALAGKKKAMDVFNSNKQFEKLDEILETL
jgi:glycosyltransferase involved in cell wall biosynthesis